MISFFSEISTLKQKLSESQSKETKTKGETTDLTKRLNDFQAKITELEKKSAKVNTLELEKNRLKGSLEEKDRNYAKLKKENEMNLDVVSQLKKEVQNFLFLTISLINKIYFLE